MKNIKVDFGYKPFDAIVVGSGATGGVATLLWPKRN